MPADRDRDLSEDLFRKIEATLSRVRAAASAPPDPPESWVKRTFGRPVPSSRQSNLNGALVDALEEAVAALRETTATARMQLEQVQRDLVELRSLSESLRERSVGIETQLTQLRQEERALRERSVAIDTQLTQLREEVSALREHSTAAEAQTGGEQGERIGQLSAELSNLRSEMSERIQHLLDEQRVSIRQVSLKASEEAVLADRARRAAELRLEEIARRLPEPPA